MLGSQSTRTIGPCKHAKTAGLACASPSVEAEQDEEKSRCGDENEESSQRPPRRDDLARSVVKGVLFVANRSHRESMIGFVKFRVVWSFPVKVPPAIPDNVNSIREHHHRVRVPIDGPKRRARHISLKTWITRMIRREMRSSVPMYHAKRSSNASPGNTESACAGFRRRAFAAPALQLAG